MKKGLVGIVSVVGGALTSAAVVGKSLMTVLRHIRGWQTSIWRCFL